MASIPGKVINILSCIHCGGMFDTPGLCECETFYIQEDNKCPVCGCHTYCYNDPARDTTMGDYCTNRDCGYVENQYMTWKEIKRSRCPLDEENCTNCLNCLVDMQ